MQLQGLAPAWQGRRKRHPRVYLQRLLPRTPQAEHAGSGTAIPAGFALWKSSTVGDVPSRAYMNPSSTKSLAVFALTLGRAVERVAAAGLDGSDLEAVLLNESGRIVKTKIRRIFPAVIMSI